MFNIQHFRCSRSIIPTWSGPRTKAFAHSPAGVSFRTHRQRSPTIMLSPPTRHHRRCTRENALETPPNKTYRKMPLNAKTSSTVVSRGRWRKRKKKGVLIERRPSKAKAYLPPKRCRGCPVKNPSPIIANTRCRGKSKIPLTDGRIHTEPQRLFLVRLSRMTYTNYSAAASARTTRLTPPIIRSGTALDVEERRRLIGARKTKPQFETSEGNLQDKNTVATVVDR